MKITVTYLTAWLIYPSLVFAAQVIKPTSSEATLKSTSNGSLFAPGKTIKVDDPNVVLKCGSYKITKATTVEDIANKCKVVEYKTKESFLKLNEELKIITANGGHINCKVVNDKLRECKIED